MINWIARFGWSVALLVGLFAVLKEEKCVVLAQPEQFHLLQMGPQWSRGPWVSERAHSYSRVPLVPTPNITITLKPYTSDKVIASWVWTSPNGHAVSAGEKVMILPGDMRR
jgi:hypothetical protein